MRWEFASSLSCFRLLLSRGAIEPAMPLTCSFTDLRLLLKEAIAILARHATDRLLFDFPSEKLSIIQCECLGDVHVFDRFGKAAIKLRIA